MKYGTIPGVGKPVSRLAQGTMMLAKKGLDGSFELLDSVFEGGVTMFDSAHCYGAANEKPLGEWMKSRGVRDKVVVLGKGAHPYDGRNRVTAADIQSDMNESFDRLQTDYIDLYVLHRDDPAVPAGEVVEILCEHVRTGRIGAFGGSNWTVERLKAANEYARSKGLVPFAVSSPNYSLALQVKPVWPGCVSMSGPEHEADRAWYKKTNMALATWSSVARGFFSGRFTSANFEQAKDKLEQCMVHAFCHPENFARLDRAYELAAEKGVTVAQIALAYVLNRPLNIFALVGAWTPAEFRDNLKALEIELTPGEMAWLNLEKNAR